MKRLIQRAYHDIYERDNAVFLIDGRVYEGFTHAEAVADYLNDLRKEGHSFDELEDTYYRPADVTAVPGITGDEHAAFAHKVLDDEDYDPTAIIGADVIYIEPWSLVNMSIDEAAKQLKEHFPEYVIVADAEDAEEYSVLIARLRGVRLKHAKRFS